MTRSAYALLLPAEPEFLAGFFIPPVTDPKKDVYGNHDGIDDIESKSKIEIVSDNFCTDAAEVTDQDETAEEDAFAAGGPAPVHTCNGQRP